ncbi:MAG: uracil phosphoribosyltransferase [Mycoplasmataceae bacterium]|jgi:uracil phosphoribosyltransferase|nr:uracil phosphoribosyltransferase [Mycoplasmataceae bacterium]
MIKVIDHPVVKVNLSKMRNKNTDSRDFKHRLIELSQFLSYEVTRDYETVAIPVETPLAKTTGFKLKDKIVLIPVLRAGLGMVEGFSAVLPSAAVGFIGLYRDEKTLNPVQYYSKMPEEIKGSNAIILDPMLATGHSAVAAIKIVKKFKPKSIKFVCVVSAPKGISEIEKYDPNIEIFTAAIDQKLNSKGYIMPGLGDAGDRIFKTK